MALISTRIQVEMNNDIEYWHGSAGLSAGNVREHMYVYTCTCIITSRDNPITRIINYKSTIPVVHS